MDNLVARAEIVRKIRRFFDGRGFLEVTTPVAIAAPAPEPHIDCPPLRDRGTDGRELYLRASPEIEMKKLLAAGRDRIYQIGPCFRAGEFGRRHRPEFTMLEWYRRDSTYLDIRRDLEEMLSEVKGGKVECATVSVRDAYREFAGWDPWSGWDQDRFDYDMAVKIEPKLPEGPVFLTDYPPPAASLSKLRGDVAERWEFYWNRIEIANCFTELCDGDEQRRRFAAAKAERQVLGESDYPLDEDFLSLLPLIGSAAGVAVGIDRLVMTLLGESDISAVLT